MIRTDDRSGIDSGRPIGHTPLVGVTQGPAEEPAGLENRVPPTPDRHAEHQRLQDAYFDAVREYHRAIQTVAQTKLNAQSTRSALDAFREAGTLAAAGDNASLTGENTAIQ